VVKYSIGYSEVTTASHTAMEAMGIKLNDLYFFNIYNPPGTNLDQQFFKPIGRIQENHHMWPL